VALLVRAARAPAGPAPRARAVDVRGRLKVAGTVAALVAYALLMEPLGFRPAMTLAPLLLPPVKRMLRTVPLAQAE
jgi:hypothetical protein